MPHIPTTWIDGVTDYDAAKMKNIEDSLVIARSVKVTPGTYTLATIIVDQEGYVTYAANGTPGAVADASTTTKGAVLLTTAASPTNNPKAVSDTDPRVAAGTPTQRGIFKASVTDADPYALLRSDPIAETRIEGLILSWVNATQISISPGATWIPSLGYTLNVPSAIPLSPTLSANAWLYVYLYSSGGVPAAEAVTTAPAAPYKGLARTKTGDSSRRYLGAIKCNAAGTGILKFRWHGSDVYWEENINAAPLLVMSDGRQATETTFSASSAVPVTSQLMHSTLAHTNASGVAMGHPQDNITLSDSVYLYRFNGTGSGVTGTDSVGVALDSSQQFTYGFFISAPTAGNGLYVRARGYRENR